MSVLMTAPKTVDPTSLRHVGDEPAIDESTLASVKVFTVVASALLFGTGLVIASPALIGFGVLNAALALAGVSLSRSILRRS